MKKSIKKNYIFNLLNQLLIIIIPFVTTPYLARVLEADGTGTYSFIHSIVSYFVLFAVLGVATYGQREISYVQGDRAKRTQVFWDTKVFQISIATIVLVFYIIFASFQEDVIIYLTFSFCILAVVADVSWFFYGMEEFGRIVVRNAIVKLANLVYIFVFVRKKEDLLLYCLGMGLFEFLSNCSLWGFLPKYVDKLDVRKIHPFSNIKAILSLFIPTIAIQIYTVLDKTMIGLITKDACENGYYEQAIKVAKIVLTIVTALGTVMIPRIGALFSEGDTKGVENAMYRGYRFVWFLGIPLCFGLIGISNNFVPWYYGEGYSKVVPLLCILSLLILAIGINNVTGMQYLIPTKRQNIFTVTVIIGAIINFVFNAILIKHYLAIGAAVASVAAETVIAVVQLVIVRKEISSPKIVFSGYKYFIAGAIMLILLRFISPQLDARFSHIVVLIAIGATVYFSLLYILRDEFFITNTKSVAVKVINRLKKGDGNNR